MICTLFLQPHVTGDHIHYIVSRPDFLYYFLRIKHTRLLFQYRKRPAGADTAEQFTAAARL